MKPFFFNSAIAAVCLMGSVGSALAQPPSASPAMPNVAVTDLAYEERVQEYFEVARIRQRSQGQSNYYGMSGSEQTEATYAAGSYSYLEQNELRNFTADLKGALLKGGGVKLIQSKSFDAGAPQPTKGEQVLHQMQTGKAPTPPVRQPKVHDIIARIKKGEFAGADYVLFGTLSNIQFRDEISPVQGSNSASLVYSLDLVSDFSLINTRTYEIKAAFSAQGSGQDVKLISSRGGRVVANRGKVIRETSQTLAESAYVQLLEQLGVTTGMPIGHKQGGGVGGSAPEARQATESPVMVFK